MCYKGSNGNFDAALIQLIRKLSDASNFFSGEHSEVRKFARSLLRDWDHTRGTDWYTSTKKEEDAMSHTVPLHTADSAKPEVNLSSDERVAALCDLSYRAGLKAGWNYCADGDQTGFERSMESTREAVAVLNEHRLKGAPDAQVARAEQEPVATILPPDPLDERTGPWLSLEDWERLRALPSGTRLYATQQPAEQPATDVDMLVEALEHIREYWNRDQNEQAMADALWHIIETADEALSGKEVNDDECAMVAQVEPIGFCEDTALSLAERTFSSDVDEQLAEVVIQYARRLHDLYTAPQTAEQQSSPDVAVLVEHERKLFEARMRRVAPGVNLEMIGDRYNDLDTQWKFELWLDRAALDGKKRGVEW